MKGIANREGDNEIKLVRDVSEVEGLGKLTVTINSTEEEGRSGKDSREGLHCVG